MNDLLGIIDGKKTYIAAAGFLVLAFLQYQKGQLELAAQSVLAALAAVGIRHAAEKAADRAADKVNQQNAPSGGASPVP